MKRVNVGLMPVILDYIKANPGKTTHEIHEAMAALKKDGKPVYAKITTSVSSLVTQLVKTHKAHYKPGGVSVSGQSCFLVYPGRGGPLSGSNRGVRVPFRKRSERNGKDEYFKTVAPPVSVVKTPTKVLLDPNAKVDVQLLIAIGSEDTMVGLAAARALYEQLKEIFDA